MTDHGRDATSPWQMPFSAWKQVLWRVWEESGKDNIGLVAAGVAFYGFLAIVPLLGATVLLYGLVADQATVVDNFRSLTSVMPPDAAKLIADQLLAVVNTSGGKKGVGLAIAIVLALFSARSAAGSVISALNIAYEEKEKRSFIWLSVLAILMTAGAAMLAVLAALAIAILAKLEALVPDAPDWLLATFKALSYVVLALVGAGAVGMLYRFGPSRSQARWVWLTPGSLFSSIFWILLTLLFGVYVANFGNYNATYGSLGAIVVMLTWLYLSSYVLLFGAEINAELEHQTRRDTTTGRSLPLGRRGAFVADHVSPMKQPSLPAQSAARAGLSDAAPLSDYMKARAGARVLQVAGVGKIGMATTALATIGLSRLRRDGRPVQGAALLAAAGALAWWRGRRTR